MDQMQTEMNLINANLIANNQSLAKVHLNKITSELYAEDLKKEIAERNERIANEITSVINETNIAIGENNQDIASSVENFNDIIEEAAAATTTTTTTTTAAGMEMSMSMNGSDSMASMSKVTDNNSNTTTETSSTITNIASYQTAKELTNVAIDLFNSTIKQNIPSNTTDNANAMELGLQQLKDMIGSKAPYDKVMGVIHGIIQTNTQEIFNLPLKTSK